MTRRHDDDQPTLDRRHFLRYGAVGLGALTMAGKRNKTHAADEPTRTTRAKSVAEGWQARGKRGAVVCGGRDSAKAGHALLKAGGNAADAGAATLLALSVTDHRLYCFGGEVPIIYHDAKRGAIEVLSGQGVAPRLATFEHFAGKRHGIPGSGPEPAAVPAVLDACLTLLDRFGSVTFTQAVAPTLDILSRRRYQWTRDLHRTLKQLVEAERKAGHDRRAGLRAVADHFYRGPVARAIDAWSRNHGGLLRFDDLATHVTRVEDAVTAEYRGHTVHKCGPWTQGPYLLQTLQLLEGYDLRKMGHLTPDTIHVCVEAMKLALADRDTYYADPLFEDVPMQALLSPRYTDARRKLIDMGRASLKQQPGDPRAFDPLLAGVSAQVGEGGDDNDTTTCLVSDGSGNLLAATPSGWGGVVAGRTGVVLGTRLQSFNAWEDHPNRIAPGKRPRITLTPTIVTKNGKPVIAVSVAGGDGQDQAALQMLSNIIDFGLTADQAVTAPRYGTNHLVGSFRQPKPKLGSLLIYEQVGSETIENMKDRGHRVTIDRPPLWHPTVLTIDPKSGQQHAAGDPKAGRHAAAL